jgi:RNA polymerase sigma-70 factor, ECF subfamily
MIQQQDVLQAQSGDPAAYERLYQIHHQKVFWLCLRITRNVADAEDLTQQTFLQAFLHLSSLKNNCTFRAWISRIAINEALMHLRRQGVSKISIEDLHETNCDRPLHGYIRTSTGINRVLIYQVMRSLPEHYQTILILRHVAGCTQKEITDWLKVPLGTTKAQLSRARRTLRQAFPD